MKPRTIELNNYINAQRHGGRSAIFWKRAQLPELGGIKYHIRFQVVSVLQGFFCTLHEPCLVVILLAPDILPQSIISFLPQPVVPTMTYFVHAIAATTCADLHYHIAASGGTGGCAALRQSQDRYLSGLPRHGLARLVTNQASESRSRF